MADITKLALCLSEYQYRKLNQLSFKRDKSPEEIANEAVYSYLAIVDPFAVDYDDMTPEQQAEYDRQFDEEYVAPDLMDIMQARRSIRQYTSEEIPEAKLDKILKAALLAPTSMNRQPCEFYLVKDRVILTKLSEAKAGGAAMLKDAAAAVVVFGDQDKADTWIEDSSIALTYMHLMATEQGVGSCWIQMHMRKSRDGNDAEENVRKIMDVPENYRVVGILSLGMPAENSKPKDLDQLDYRKIHYVE